MPWWLRHQLSEIRGRLLHAAAGAKTPSTGLSSLPPTAGLEDDSAKQEEELDDSIGSTSVTTTTTKTSEGGGERGGENNKGGRTRNRREVEEGYQRRHRKESSLQSSSLSECSSYYDDHADERERRQGGITGRRFLVNGHEGKAYGSRSIYDDARRQHQIRDGEEKEKFLLQSIQGEWMWKSHIRRRGSREEDKFTRYDVRGGEIKEGERGERERRDRGGERRARTTRRERSQSQESSWSDVLCEVEVQARNREGLQDHHEDSKKGKQAGEPADEETSFFPFRMIGFRGRKHETEKETKTAAVLSSEGKEGEELKKEKQEASGLFSPEQGKEVFLQQKQGDRRDTERTSDHSRALSVEDRTKIEEEEDQGDHHDSGTSVSSRRIKRRSEGEDDWGGHRLSGAGKNKPFSSSLNSHSLPSSSSSSRPSSPSFPYFVYSSQGRQLPTPSLPLPPGHLLPSPYRPAHSPPPPFLSRQPSARRPPPPSRPDPSGFSMYRHTNYLSPPTSAFTASSIASSSGRASDRVESRKTSSEEAPHGRRRESHSNRYGEEYRIDVSAAVSRGEGGSKKDRGDRRFSRSTAPFVDSFASSASLSFHDQQSHLRYLWYQYYSRAQPTRADHSYEESLMDRTDTEATSAQLGEGEEKKNEAGEKENKEIKESLSEKTMRRLGRRRKQESAGEVQGQEEEEEGASDSRSVCLSVATTHRGGREETRQEEEEENELADFFFGGGAEGSSSNEEKDHHVGHVEPSSQDVDRTGFSSYSYTSQPPFVLHSVSYPGHSGVHTPLGILPPSGQPLASHPMMNHQALPPGSSSVGGSYPCYLPPSPFVSSQHLPPSFPLPHHLPSSPSGPPYFDTTPAHMPYPPYYYYHSNYYPSSVSSNLLSSSSLPGYSSSYPYNLHSDNVGLIAHPSLASDDVHATNRNRGRYSKSPEETSDKVSKAELSSRACHGTGESKVSVDGEEETRQKKKKNEKEREEEKKADSQVCRERFKGEQGGEDSSFLSTLFSSKRVGILPSRIGWTSGDNNRGEKNSIDVGKPNKDDREKETSKTGEERKHSPRPPPIILKMPSWNDDISVEDEREKKEKEKSSSENSMNEETKGMTTTSLSSTPVPSHCPWDLFSSGSVNKIAKFSPCTPEGRSDEEGRDEKTSSHLKEKRSYAEENEEKRRRRSSLSSEDHMKANQATAREEEEEAESRSFTHASLPGKLVLLEKVVSTLFIPSSSTSASSSSAGMKGRRTRVDRGDQDSSSRNDGRLSYLLGGGGNGEGEEHHEREVFFFSSSSSSSSHLLPPPDVDFDICTDNPIDPSVLVDRNQQGNEGGGEDHRLLSRFLHAATSTTVNLLSTSTSSLSLIPSPADRKDDRIARGRNESIHAKRDNIASHSSRREGGKASQRRYYGGEGSSDQEREREELGDFLHTCGDEKGKLKMDWRHLLFHKGKEDSHVHVSGGGEQEDEDELYVITWGRGGSSGGGVKDSKGSKNSLGKQSRGVAAEEERPQNRKKVTTRMSSSSSREDRQGRRMLVAGLMKQGRDVKEDGKDLIKRLERRREDREGRRRTPEIDEGSFFPWWSSCPPAAKKTRGDCIGAVKILRVKEKKREEGDDLLKKENKKQRSRERLKVYSERKEEEVEQGKRRSRRKEQLRGSGSEAEGSGRTKEEKKRDVKKEEEKEEDRLAEKNMHALVARDGYQETRRMRRDNCRDRLMTMINREEEERRRLKERRRKWKRRRWGMRIERRDYVAIKGVLHRRSSVLDDDTEKKEEQQGEEKRKKERGEGEEEEDASFGEENTDDSSQKTNELQRDLHEGSDGNDQEVKRRMHTRETYSLSVLQEKDKRQGEAKSQQAGEVEKADIVAREANERERPSEEEQDEREEKEEAKHEEDDDDDEENKRCNEEEEVLIFMEPCDEGERKEEEEEDVSVSCDRRQNGMHNVSREGDEDTPRMKEREEEGEEEELVAKKETRDVTDDKEEENEKQEDQRGEREDMNEEKEERGAGLIEGERGVRKKEAAADREEGERLRGGDSTELVIYLDTDPCNQKHSVSHTQRRKSSDKPLFSSSSSGSFEEPGENPVFSLREGNEKRTQSPVSSSLSSHESKDLSHSSPRERLSHSTPSPFNLSLPPAFRKQRLPSSSSDLPPLPSIALSHRHHVSSLTPPRTSPRCSSFSSSSSSFSPSLPEGSLTTSFSSSSSDQTFAEPASSTSSPGLPHLFSEPSSSCSCSPSLASRSSPWKVFLQDAMNRSLSALTATANQAAYLVASEASKTFLSSSSSHDLHAPPHCSSSSSRSPVISPSRTGFPSSSLYPTPRFPEELQSSFAPQHSHERDLLHVHQDKEEGKGPSFRPSSSCERTLFVTPVLGGEVTKEQEHRDVLLSPTSSSPAPFSVSSTSDTSSSSSFSRPSFSLFSSSQGAPGVDSAPSSKTFQRSPLPPSLSCADPPSSSSSSPGWLPPLGDEERQQVNDEEDTGRRIEGDERRKPKEKEEATLRRRSSSPSRRLTTHRDPDLEEKEVRDEEETRGEEKTGEALSRGREEEDVTLPGRHQNRQDHVALDIPQPGDESLEKAKSPVCDGSERNVKKIKKKESDFLSKKREVLHEHQLLLMLQQEMLLEQQDAEISLPSGIQDTSPSNKRESED